MATHFLLLIELGNDAMQNRIDIGEAVSTVHEQLYDGRDDDGNISDANGNIVGGWTFTDDPLRDIRDSLET